MQAHDVDGRGAKPRRSRDFIQSLERGLLVVRAFGAGRSALTLSEVAEATKLTRASVRRCLLTLIELGYVETDGRLFRLRPRVLELGYSYLSSLSVPEIALPHAERLATEVGESIEAAVLDETEIVYILRIPGPRLVTISVNVGGRNPAHASSLGKILLASLDDEELDRYFDTVELTRYTPQTITDPHVLREQLMTAREAGWASTDQELEEGLRAVAVPIRTAGGEMIAAINVSSSVIFHTMKSLRTKMLPPLQATAQQIEADLNLTLRRDARSRV